MSSGRQSDGPRDPPISDDPLAREAVRARLFGGPPPRIGRYRVIRRIGSGGMGVVYLADDVELDRRVAVKMIGDDGDARMHARLPDEARALALLSHPNVVQVYDVGIHAGRFYIAMELVDGTTLRHWQRKRTSAEILAIYREVGRGVAAAHAAGLLHCDLKPDNILVGSDGRPRVVDFGLATMLARDVDTDEQFDRARSRFLSTRGGTPEYMAPEQFAGASVDPRTDVFGFCVALFEALCGQHPRTDASSGRRTLGPDVVADPARLPAHLDRSIRAAIIRGLAREPERRFASMDALLDALRPRPRRWPVPVFVASGVALTVAIAGGQPEPAIESPCGRLDPLPWDHVRSGALAEGFARAQPAFGASLWQAVATPLDDRLGAFADARAQACTGALAPAAVACLADVRAGLAQALALLEGGDPEAIERAPKLIDRVPRARDCLGDDGPSAPAPAVLALDQRIAALEVRLAAGEEREIAAEVGGIVDEARASGDRRSLVLAELLAARVLGPADYARAAEWFSEAYFIASELELGEEALYAALGRVELAMTLGEPDVGFEWLTHAEGVKARFELDEHARLLLARWRVNALNTAGRLAEADQLSRRALDEVLAGDASDELIAAIHNDRGNLMLSLSRPREAEAAFREGLRREREIWGDEHPRLVPVLIGLASAVDMQGQHEAAAAALHRAEDMLLRAEGPSAPRLTMVFANLANVIDAEDPQAALQMRLRALELAEANGFSPMRLADIRHGLGNSYRELGDLDAAAGQFEAERALVESAQGTEHPDIGHALHSLGRIELARGRYDAAQRAFDRVLSLWTKAYGPDHPLVAFPLSSLGELALARGRADEARPLLRRALAVREADPGPPDKLAQTRFLLAKALWPELGARGEARALAQAARDGYAALGPGELAHRDEVDAWLRRR